MADLESPTLAHLPADLIAHILTHLAFAPLPLPSLAAAARIAPAWRDTLRDTSSIWRAAWRAQRCRHGVEGRVADELGWMDCRRRMREEWCLRHGPVKEISGGLQVPEEYLAPSREFVTGKLEYAAGEVQRLQRTAQVQGVSNRFVIVAVRERIVQGAPPVEKISGEMKILLPGVYLLSNRTEADGDAGCEAVAPYEVVARFAPPQREGHKIVRGGRFYDVKVEAEAGRVAVVWEGGCVGVYRVVKSEPFVEVEGWFDVEAAGVEEWEVEVAGGVVVVVAGRKIVTWSLGKGRVMAEVELPEELVEGSPKVAVASDGKKGVMLFRRPQPVRGSYFEAVQFCVDEERGMEFGTRTNSRFVNRKVDTSRGVVSCASALRQSQMAVQKFFDSDKVAIFLYDEDTRVTDIALWDHQTEGVSRRTLVWQTVNSEEGRLERFAASIGSRALGTHEFESHIFGPAEAWLKKVVAMARRNVSAVGNVGEAHLSSSLIAGTDPDGHIVPIIQAQHGGVSIFSLVDATSGTLLREMATAGKGESCSPLSSLTVCGKDIVGIAENGAVRVFRSSYDHTLVNREFKPRVRHIIDVRDSCKDVPDRTQIRLRARYATPT